MASGPLTDRPFSSFSELSHDTVSFLKEAGFEYVTPVQAAVVPLFAANADVVVDACTGSGKTLAFLLPLLEKLRRYPEPPRPSDVKRHPNPKERVMVIGISCSDCTNQRTGNPNIQCRQTIHSEADIPHPLQTRGRKVQSLESLTASSVSPVSTDVAWVHEHGGNVIVGTPGRINDIMKKDTQLKFNTVEVLVLDEADRLLDLGFETQLLEIVHGLPKQRRTGLFSATQTDACEALVKAGLRNPVRVNVTTTVRGTSEVVEDLSQKTPQSLTISAVVIPLDQKFNQLVQFLSDHCHEKIIVYGLTCASIDYWFYVLRKLQKQKGMTVRALHGRMQQNGRERAMSSFAADASGVLLATDVAARGLDIPEVHWVVQLDAPQNPNAFVHRVGRTARMGRTGEALIYLAPNEEQYIKFLQMRKVPVKREQPIREAEDFIPWLRQLSETEREAMVKGIAAYTSYIRAYSNHHCPYVFTLKELDFGKLAYAFGLLYLPGMKEIKVKGDIDFIPSRVDPRTIQFIDKARESDRRALLRRLEIEAAMKSKEKPLGKKRSLKASAVSDKQQPKTKKTRNVLKRDMDELENDYKMYRLEKKQKTKRTSDAEHQGIHSNNDRCNDLSDIPDNSRPRTSTSSVSKGACQTSKMHQQTQTMTQAPTEAMSKEKTALKASLRRKLESMQRLRKSKKPRSA